MKNRLNRYQKTILNYLALLLVSGLGATLLLILFSSPPFFVAFGFGYGMVFLVEAFFAISSQFFVSKTPHAFLKKFFRAELQKMVFFVLLLAAVLRYSRADFLGLLLGVIFALIVSRLLMLLLSVALKW